jgi:hypothetical protein
VSYILSYNTCCCYIHARILRLFSVFLSARADLPVGPTGRSAEGHMIRRDKSSGGLLATSFGGSRHFEVLSTYPLTDLCSFLMISRSHTLYSRFPSRMFSHTISLRAHRICIIIHLYSVFDRPPTLFVPHLILAHSSLFSHVFTPMSYLF